MVGFHCAVCNTHFTNIVLEIMKVYCIYVCTVQAWFEVKIIL